MPEVPTNGGLTRRELLRKAVKVGVVLATGVAVREWIWDQLVNPPRRLPDSPVASISLEATATSLLQNEKQTSFQEEDGFNNEFFNKVRAGVYAMDVIVKRGDDRVGSSSTSWLAQEKNGAYYFVTNKHVVQPIIDNPPGFAGLNLWRPGIDGENKFEANPIQIAYSNILDLAIVRCKGSFNPGMPALNWEDNVTLQPNEKILIVGFPHEFRITRPNFLTEGAVLTVVSVDSAKKQWVAKGLTSPGSSGSPVVVNKDGSPIVVGIASQASDRVLKENEKEERKMPVVLGYELDVSGLIALFKED